MARAERSAARISQGRIPKLWDRFSNLSFYRLEGRFHRGLGIAIRANLHASVACSHWQGKRSMTETFTRQSRVDPDPIP